MRAIHNFRFTAKACLKCLISVLFFSLTVLAVSAQTQSPYGGAARNIPGHIEVIDYDEGGEGIAYHDVEATNLGSTYGIRIEEGVDITKENTEYGIGWFKNGEWLEYTVDVVAGTYDISLRIAAVAAGKQLKLYLDNSLITTLDIPNTGSWVPQTITFPGISLPGGTGKVLKLENVNDDFDLHWIEFTSDVSVPVTSVTVSPTSLSYSSAAGSQTVNVTSNTSWNVSDDRSWITTSGSSGSGNGSFTVSATANTGAARSGTVTVVGGTVTRTISVSQAATGEISLSPSSLSLPSTSGTHNVTVTSPGSWSATKTDSWITSITSSGTTGGNLAVTVAENTTGNSRSGNITVTSGSVNSTLSVTQTSAGSGGSTSPWEVDGNGNVYILNGNVGIGTVASTFPLVIKHPSYSINATGDHTTNTVSLSMNNAYSIPDGFTDLGWRTPLFIDASVYNPNFIGTLDMQFGANITYGVKFGASGTINNSVGLYLNGYDNGSVPIPNKFGIYQAGANFKNYFEGKVGIGTDNPNAKLEIKSSGAIYSGTPTFLIRDLTNRGTMVLESVTDNPTDLVFKNNGAGRVWFSSRESSSEYAFNIYTNPDGNSTPDKLAMTIKQNGNVGIGTTSPDATLTVNGNIKAERIDVVSSISLNGILNAGQIRIMDEVPASDHVFQTDYSLMTLADLDAFIKANKHLPEVPSAEEFKENGYSVGEMDDMLLRKIEELTLYIIDLKEIIDEQGEDNRTLKAVVEVQQGLIDELMKK
jgi:hypothetical protein